MTDHKKLTSGYLRLALDNNFIASSMLTMTFDRKKRTAITYEYAYFMFRQLIKKLNQYVGGIDYRRKWGHSYFGYIWSAEYHKDGVFHSHAVVDNWISFRLFHDWWGEHCGHAWTRITKNPYSATKYVVKYLVKSNNEPTYFFQSRRRIVVPETGQIFPADDFKDRSLLSGQTI
jgi:hypothetical protein